LSGQKWAVKNVDSKELIADATKRFQAGDFSAIPDLIKGATFGEQGLGDSRPAGLWNEKLGLKQEDLEQTVKDVLEGRLAGSK